MSLERLTVRDRGSDNYATYWAVLACEGELWTFPLRTTAGWEEAEAELRARKLKKDCEAVAVAQFTHPAYNDPAAARQHAVDMILDAASAALGIPPAYLQEEEGPDDDQ